MNGAYCNNSGSASLLKPTLASAPLLLDASIEIAETRSARKYTYETRQEYSKIHRDRSTLAPVMEAAYATSAKTLPARRLKVVFMIRALEVGGTERQLVELAKRLDRTTFDVTVLCFYRGGALVGELLNAGVPVVSLDKKGRWEVCRFLLRMAKELRQRRPDILHGYMTGPNLVAVLMKPILRSTRIVWGIRASNVVMNGWLDRLLPRLEALFSSQANLVIFNSVAGEAYCRSMGFAKALCVVVPNGVDVERFCPDRGSSAEQRISWGIPPASFLIGLVGRIDPMKDHPTFLKAAAIFTKSRPDARFVCIGSGPHRYLGELRTLAKECGVGDKTVWTGIVDDMPSAYRALDICCLSSLGEGTPNCVAEAMACGIPCVVTDVGDARRIVGETGIVVPPQDPQALAEGWTAMAERLVLEPEVGHAARARVNRIFSTSKLVQTTSDILLKLL
jgi:glycosyltransferase involved in cell wall biosynthesis